MKFMSCEEKSIIEILSRKFNIYLTILICIIYLLILYNKFLV